MVNSNSTSSIITQPLQVNVQKHSESNELRVPALPVNSSQLTIVSNIGIFFAHGTQELPTLIIKSFQIPVSISLLLNWLSSKFPRL